MRSKKIFFLVFALIILSIPAYLIFSSEDVLENGNRHKIRLQGYDPFDPFRGKYLRLNYDDLVPCDFELDKGELAYVVFEKDSLGFSNFSYAYANQPGHNDFLKTTVLYISNGQARIKLDNITKYFINESKAAAAENLIQDFTRNRPNDIYVAIRVLDGEVRLEDIFVEETPLLDYLDK